MKLKHLWVVLLAMCLCHTAYAKGDKKEKVEKQTVYMFAVGAAFGDTIVSFTDIQMIEGENIVNKGFLKARNMYSYQFKNYLENVENLPHRTCAIYFSQKKTKLEKKYAKLKARYEADKELATRTVDSGKFQFQLFDAE